MKRKQDRASRKLPWRWGVSIELPAKWQYLTEPWRMTIEHEGHGKIDLYFNTAELEAIRECIDAVLGPRE